MKTTAIIQQPREVVYRNNRPVILNEEDIKLIRQLCAKDASEEEFKLFMHVCKKSKLDPFLKQIYCVIWPTDGGKSHEMVIITGIGGFRKMAAEHHKDFAGTSSAKFTFSTTPQKTPANKLIPESATVTAYRKGGGESDATVYWEEFAPTDLRASRASFWNTKPKHMLAKCAEAHALRKAFPGLGNIFTPEEVESRLEDYTEGGRQIVDDRGFSPNGAAVTYGAQRTGSKEAQAKVLAEKLANHGQKAPETVPGASWKAQKDAKSDSAPIDVKPEPAHQEQQYRGVVEIDQTVESDPIIRGDIADLMELINKHCEPVWGKDQWYHIPPRHVETLMAMCAQIGPYKVKHVLPKTPPPSKQAAKQEVPKSSAAKGVSGKQTTSQAGSAGAKPTASEPYVVSGTIERVNAGMAGKTPVRQVTLLLAGNKKLFLGDFHKSHWEHLDWGLGKFGSFAVVTKGNYTNIERLVKVGSREWDEEGLPAIQLDREPGTPGLFK